MISLEKFNSKWDLVIRDMIKIYWNGDDVNLYMPDQVRKQFEEKLENSESVVLDKEVEDIDEVIDKEIEKFDEKLKEENDKTNVDFIDDWDVVSRGVKKDTPPNANKEFLRGLSDRILDGALEESVDVDIKNFSLKKEGFEVKVNKSEVKTSFIYEFFEDFCNLDIFELAKIDSNMPDILYLKEMFNFNKFEPIANYAVYLLLMYRNNTIEFKVLRDLLLMFMIYQDVLSPATARINVIIKRLNIDISDFYLRAGMLFSVSEIIAD